MLPPAPVSAEAPARRASLVLATKYVLRVPTFYVLLGESMLTGLGMWIFFTWLPVYFRETYNMPLAAAGFAGTFMLQISVAIGVMVGGWISDRAAANSPHRRMLLYAIFYLIGAPCLLLFLSQPSFGVVAVGVSAFSSCAGWRKRTTIRCNVRLCRRSFARRGWAS